MRIPFGKFKGYSIEDIPDDYFAWLQTIELRDPLRAAICAEAKARQFKDESDNYNGNAPRIAVVDQLVSAGLRSLARKHHPDVGGIHERMVEIISAADWVKSQARLLL